MDRNNPDVVSRLMSLAGLPSAGGRGASQSTSYSRQQQQSRPSTNTYRGEYTEQRSSVDTSRMGYQTYRSDNAYYKTPQAVQSDHYNNRSTDQFASKDRYSGTVTSSEIRPQQVASYQNREQVNFQTWQNNAGLQTNVQTRTENRSHALYGDSVDRSHNFGYKDPPVSNHTQKLDNRTGDVRRSQYENVSMYERRAEQDVAQRGMGYEYLAAAVEHRPGFESHQGSVKKEKRPLLTLEGPPAKRQSQEFMDHPQVRSQQPQFENGPRDTAPLRQEEVQGDGSQALGSLIKGGMLQGIEGLVVNTTAKLLETILTSGVLQGVQANVSQQVVEKLIAGGGMQGLGSNQGDMLPHTSSHVLPHTSSRVLPHTPMSSHVPSLMSSHVPMGGIGQQMLGNQQGSRNARRRAQQGNALLRTPTNLSMGSMGGGGGGGGSLQADTARQLVDNLYSAGILTGLDGPEGYASRQVIEKILTGGISPGPTPRATPGQGYRNTPVGGVQPRFDRSFAGGRQRPPLLQGHPPRQYRPLVQNVRGRGREQFKQQSSKQPMKLKKKEPPAKQNISKPPAQAQKRPSDNANTPAAKKPKTNEAPKPAPEPKKERNVWTWTKILALCNKDHAWGEEEDADVGMGSEGGNRLRLPGMIKDANRMWKGDHGGIVSFKLPNGEELEGNYKDERAIANNYCLKTMRLYTGNQTLTLPFKEGMNVSVVYMLGPIIKKNSVSYMVDIELHGEVPGSLIELEDLSTKDIPNLDGSEVEGTVVAQYRQSGIASFKVGDSETPQLTHFKVVEAIVGGEKIPHVTCGYVLYINMKVKLKIVTSNANKIPGIYHTSEACLDIPLSPGEGETQSDAAVYRGVILKTVDDKPRVLFCVCQTRVKDKFYVICEDSTVNGGSTTESHLHFGEGTRVICNLKFKHDYGTVTPSGVYVANVDLPLRKAVVKMLRQSRGISYPGVLATTFDTKEMNVFVARNNFKINGKKPDSSFPHDFFKPGMVIEINHCTDSQEFTVSLDISTNILKMKEALEASITPVTTIDIPPLKRSSRRKPKRRRLGDGAQKSVSKEDSTTNGSGPLKSTDSGATKPIDSRAKGVVTAVKADPRGNILPTTAKALIGGVETKVHIDEVFVNGKLGLHVPRQFIKVGDPIAMQKVKQDTSTQRCSASVQLFFPKEVIKNVWDAHVARMSKLK